MEVVRGGGGLLVEVVCPIGSWQLGSFFPFD